MYNTDNWLKTSANDDDVISQELHINIVPFHSQLLMEEIKTYEPVFHDIQNHCTEQSERLETKAERDDMVRIMLDFATRWKNVKRSMAERRKEMERLYPVVVLYVETRTEFQTWLRQDERTLTELALESGINDMDSLEQKKNVLKVCNVCGTH